MNSSDKKGFSYNPPPVAKPNLDIDEEVISTIVKKVFVELQESNMDTVAQRTAPIDKVPIGISVRHLHICREHLDELFGPGYEITHYRDLYQPGTFAAKETVSVIGPRRRMLENVRILAPLRDYTQFEVARTDAVYLGVDAPLRDSGDIKGSAPMILLGPKGMLDLPEGVIRARRHIHMNPREAEALGIKNGQVVKLHIPGECGVTFENVLVYVKEGLRMEVHLDTDEGNVADVRNHPDVKIIK